MMVKARSEIIAFEISFFIIVLTFAMYVVGVLGFALNIPISPFHLPVSFALAYIVFLALQGRGENVGNPPCLYNRRSLLVVFIATLLFCVSLFASALFYDISWDGCWYHQDAVFRLGSGWNPLREPFAEEDRSCDPFILHYPKAIWIIQSVIYKFSGGIQFAKALLPFLMASLFCFFFAVVDGIWKNRLWALLISGLITFNPVALAQVMTFYNDGIFYVLSLFVFSIMALAHFGRLACGLQMRVMLVFSAVLLSNSKFTGLITVIAGFAMFSLLDWLKERRFSRSMVRRVSLYAITTAVAVLPFGYNPYITNFVKAGHPLHPVLGDERIDIITANLPPDMVGRNRFEKAFMSYFSVCANHSGQSFASSRLKLPATITPDEISECWEPDVRLSGFGPLFSLTLVLAAVAFVIFSMNRGNRRRTEIMVFSGLFLVMMVVTNPEFWWARYVPYVWAGPVFVLFCGLHSLRSGHQPLKPGAVEWLCRVSILVMLVNISIVGKRIASNHYHATKSIREHLREMKSRNQTVEIKYDEVFWTQRLQLDEENIAYREIKTADSSAFPFRCNHLCYRFSEH